LTSEYLIRGSRNHKSLADWRGSVRLVVDASAGDVAQRIDYDSFGRVTADSSPGSQPFGSAGGLYDADTKLVRFGARDYDAEIGRRMNPDPILFNGGPPDLYAYAAARRSGTLPGASSHATDDPEASSRGATLRHPWGCAALRPGRCSCMAGESRDRHRTGVEVRELDRLSKGERVASAVNKPHSRRLLPRRRDGNLGTGAQVRGITRWA
jgi:RHS repeat-associated protein